MALPQTLQQTRGLGPHETACPICYDDFESNSLTAEHLGCGRRFDDECLRIWLQSTSTYPKCPVCRAPLVALDPWEMSPQERADEVIAARQRLPAPVEYAINWDSQKIFKPLRRENPHKTDEEIEESLMEELYLSLDAVETIGLHEDLHAISAQDLVGRLDKLNIGVLERRELWTCSRLFGNPYLILHSVSAVPGVGVWLPLPPFVEIVQRQTELQRFFTDKVLHAHMREGSSELLQIPIPTDFLDTYLGCARLCSNPLLHVKQALEVARECGATHWGVLDFRQVEHGPDIVLMPWPAGLIPEGFDYLEFPGWGPRDCAVTYGWDAPHDSAFLESFIGRNRLNFVQSIRTT